MSHKATKWALTHDLPAMQKIVLLILADRYNDNSKRCHPSHFTISKDVGMSVRSVITQLGRLELSSHISTLRTKSKGRNNANQYSLNFEFIGSLRACKKKFDSEGAAHGGSEGAAPHSEGAAHGGSEGAAHGGSEGAAHRTGKDKPVSINQEENGGERESSKNNQPSLSPPLDNNDPLKGCFEWAMDQEFWSEAITSEVKFMSLYSSNKPNGLKAQYESHCQAVAFSNNNRNHNNQQPGQVYEINGTNNQRNRQGQQQRPRNRREHHAYISKISDDLHQEFLAKEAAARAANTGELG